MGNKQADRDADVDGDGESAGKKEARLGQANDGQQFFVYLQIEAKCAPTSKHSDILRRR